MAARRSSVLMPWLVAARASLTLSAGAGQQIHGTPGAPNATAPRASRPAA